MIEKPTSSTPTTSSLTLKSIVHLTHQNEVTSSFCLQTSNDFVIFKSKDIGIMKIDHQPEYHQSKFQLSSRTFENSSYNVVETLKVNEKQLFKSMDHQQKNDAMLSGYLFPNCLSKNPSILKCHISASSRLLPPIIASLSSTGSLQISKFHHDRDSNESILQNICELCESRKSSHNLGTFLKLDKLQTTIDELMFYNFSWCPEIVGSKRLLAALTRSRDVVFYSFSSENEVNVLYTKKLDNSVNLVKWVKHRGDNFLFVDGVKGALIQYSITLSDDGSITDLQKVNEMIGQLKIPISHVEESSVDEALIIVAAKSHSIEVFSTSSSITKYVGVSVTGITSISNIKSTFLITTLDNEISFMEVTKNGENLTISTFTRVTILNSQIPQEKFRSYGIAASKNKVLVYTALYPETANDHLTLKQPLHITITQFSLNDPHKILLENQSLRLTEYQDCVEVIRYVGTGKLETMASLTVMDYDIELTEKFAYYLKIQLLVTESKLVFYKTRSENIYDTTNETKASIKKIIDIFHAYKALKQFKPKKNQSKLLLLAIRCLSNFVANYILEDIQKPPFNQAQQIFKEDLTTVSNDVKAMSCLKGIKTELCYYCEADIEADKLTCPNNHQPMRCSMTKLQLNASAMNFCPRCNCNVMDLQTLKEVTGHDDHVCTYCDGYISFA